MYGMRKLWVSLLLFGCLTGSAFAAVNLEDASLLQIFEVLKEKQFVDMTHAFTTEIPHWPGFDAMKMEKIYDYDPDGFYAHRYTLVGQWGTHVDPPAHFIKGLRTADQIGVKEMIAPLAVLDIREKVQKNPDYEASIADLEEWESRNGRLPEGTFVALRTGWHKRWPDAKAFQNADEKGVSHFPGWGLSLLKTLFEDRKVRAIGHETTDTDAGYKGNMECETYVLSKNCYQIELLANTDSLPEWGALAVVTWPKPLNGSGFPARVFAILP